MRDDPAFPIFDNEGSSAHDGLTKREYFAGLAMQAFIKRGNWVNEQVLSAHSICAADALIKELDK